MYFWIAPLRCKQKPLLKQLWPTRNKIAWLGTDLVLDFLLDYVKVRLNSTTGLQRNTFSKLSYIILIHQNVPKIMSIHLGYMMVS